MRKVFSIEWNETNAWQNHFANSIMDWIKFYVEQKSSFGVPKLKELPDKKEPEWCELRGALARGYCSSSNENKVLDPDLIEAMAVEVEKIAPKPQEVKEIERKPTLSYDGACRDKLNELIKAHNRLVRERG